MASPMQQAIDEHEARQAERVALTPVRSTPPEYTDDERTHGLMALAACAGSSRRAEKVLADHGLKIPEGTLRGWSRRYAEDYRRFVDQFASRLEGDLVSLARETAIQAAMVERKAIEKAEARIDGGRDYDPAKTAVAMSRIKATAIDRLFTLTGRPQTIVEHRRAEEMIRSLVSLGVVEVAPEDVREIDQDR